MVQQVRTAVYPQLARSGGGTALPLIGAKKMAVTEADRLAELARVRQETVELIVHDLRTPLTAIKGLLVNLIEHRFSSHPPTLHDGTAPFITPGDFGTPEQQIPATGLAGVDWESCMTMDDLWWGWHPAARMLFKMLDRQTWKESRRRLLHCSVHWMWWKNSRWKSKKHSSRLLSVA